MIIRIEFKGKDSSHLSWALQEAEKINSFKNEGRFYSVTYERKDGASVHNFLKRVSLVRSKKVFIDEKEIPWKEFARYLSCFNAKIASFHPEQYCHGLPAKSWDFNLCSCIHGQLFFNRISRWLSYGHFDSDDRTFIFNKEKIKERLLENLNFVQFCPVIDIERALKMVDTLPETVNPSIDNDWKYLQQKHGSYNVFGGIKSISDLEERDEIIGVCPSSVKSAEKIFNKMISKVF